MASIQEPNLGLNYGWATGESGWANQMDENIRSIGALMFPSVVSFTTASPPGILVPGARYLVPAGATGLWAGEEDNLVRWNVSSVVWESYIPQEGWILYAEDTKIQYHYDGLNWAPIGSRYPTSSVGLPVGAIYNNAGVLTVA